MHIWFELIVKVRQLSLTQLNFVMIYTCVKFKQLEFGHFDSKKRKSESTSRDLFWSHDFKMAEVQDIQKEHCPLSLLIILFSFR